jgi:hypothetical protein
MDFKTCISTGQEKKGLRKWSAESMTNRSFGRFFCCNNKDNGGDKHITQLCMAQEEGAVRAESGVILNLCSSPQKDTHDTNIKKY